MRIWIRDPVSFWPLDPGWVKKSTSGSGMNILDHISESSKTIVLKYFNSLMRIRKSFWPWIRDRKHSDPYSINISDDPQHCLIWWLTLMWIRIQKGFNIRKMIWDDNGSRIRKFFSHPGPRGQISTGSATLVPVHIGLSFSSTYPTDRRHWYLRKHRRKDCKFLNFSTRSNALIRIRFEVTCRNGIRIETRNTGMSIKRFF